MRHLATLRFIEAIARHGSIRKAAEAMALAPSAMQRRLQAFEEDLGQPIFERLPQGVRLNAAGELAIHHIRNQIAETERLRSRVADLAGMRRGHVSIGCSQALAADFLPNEIAAYRAGFPAVSFDVRVMDHARIEQALEDFSIDIAIAFDSEAVAGYQTLLVVRQDIVALLASDHPLAARERLRLRDCLEWPLALPSEEFCGRQLLEKALRRGAASLEPLVQTNSFEFLRRYVRDEHAITFQIPIGVPEGEQAGGLATRPVDGRDLPGGFLLIGQRRDRTLPVAAARFADRLAGRLAERFDVLG